MEASLFIFHAIKKGYLLPEEVHETLSKFNITIKLESKTTEASEFEASVPEDELKLRNIFQTPEKAFLENIKNFSLPQNNNNNNNNIQLFDAYKALIAVTSSPNKLKNIPKQITTYKRARDHINLTFVPKIIIPLFGSLHHFLLLLFGGKEARHMYNTFFDEEIHHRLQIQKNKYQHEIKSSIQDCFKRINEHLLDISPLLLKGCFISASSYEKIRTLISFNLNPMSPSIILRSSLPKITKQDHEYMYVFLLL